MLEFLVQTDRPSVAGILLLAVLFIQPVWFVAERYRSQGFRARIGTAIVAGAFFTLLVKLPGGYFFGLAPLLAANIWLWIRHRHYRKAREALSAEVETSFLDLPARKDIETMIREVEKASSAEIRVLVELDFAGDPSERARAFFHELRMDVTEQGTGVLFYFALRQKQFAVFGAVPDALAQKAVQLGEEAFRQAKFADGIVAMIGELIDHLTGAFPPRPGDRNELEDRVIVLI